MQVNEIFTSIQGEGVGIGKRAVFVRLQGCDLDCDWCDTEYAQGKGGEERHPTEVADSVYEMKDEYNVDKLVITGGEPTIHKEELEELLQQCKEMDITIETHGGTEELTDMLNNPKNQIVFWSISPKLSNANTEYDVDTFAKNVQELHTATWHYQMKFVVESQEDIEESIELMKQARAGSIKYPEVVYQPVCSPQMAEDDSLYMAGLNKVTEAVEEVFGEGDRKNIARQIRVLPQMHVLLWGNKRGK